MFYCGVTETALIYTLLFWFSFFFYLLVSVDLFRYDECFFLALLSISDFITFFFKEKVRVKHGDQSPLKFILYQ
ncbi:hypothetical protein BDF21DRAFT_133788 [Thamnidium elegans]|nr:hypothetical protein BDF21DRAFT_133788 [Thamnidium elegans]